MIKRAYSVKLTNYSLENMDKDSLKKNLESKERQLQRIIEDATKDFMEVQSALKEVEALND